MKNITNFIAGACGAGIEATLSEGLIKAGN